MTAVEEIVHVEQLPAFQGWPQPDDWTLSNTIYEIDSSGQIATSDRHDRGVCR